VAHLDQGGVDADICGLGRDGEVTLKGSLPGGSALVGQGQKLCVLQVQAFFLGSPALIKQKLPGLPTRADYNRQEPYYVIWDWDLCPVWPDKHEIG
jgi:hypothetical protein